jgi:UDP-glucose 4-epimerase
VEKVLVTGGSGFIGRNLVEAWKARYDITAPTSKELDLTNHESVEQYLKTNDFDVVVHTATWNATANSSKDREQVLEKNLAMFFNLVRMEDRYGKLIYFGSGAEYGRDHYLPRMMEDYFDTHAPIDQYGFSKYIMAKCTNMSNKIVDLRVFGCYGPYEDWEVRFISNAVCKALYGLPITLRQNVYFDYIWVNDLVRITEWFVRNEGQYKHYNACTGSTIDLVTLANLINKVTGANVPIVIGQQGLKPEYSGSNERLLSEMKGFRFTKLEDALSELCRYYSANMNLIDRNRLLKDKV